jgi:hypothetical protein
MWNLASLAIKDTQVKRQQAEKQCLDLSHVSGIRENIPTKVIPRLSTPLASSGILDTPPDIANAYVDWHGAVVKDVNASSMARNQIYVLLIARPHPSVVLYQRHNESPPRVAHTSRLLRCVRSGWDCRRKPRTHGPTRHVCATRASTLKRPERRALRIAPAKKASDGRSPHAD